MTKEHAGSKKVSEKLRCPLSRVVAASLLLWTSSPLGAAESGGDYHVNASGTQAGNLSVDGSLDVAGDGDFGGFLQLGSTLEEPAFPALKFSYTEDALGVSATMSARRAGVAFLWEDNLAGTPKSKMKLSGDNVLTLFDANGNPGLVLSPASGIALTAGKSLTLSDGTVLSGAGSLKSSALYDSGGNARLWLDSNNNLVVSTPTSFTSDATFAQGVKFSNGETLNGQSAKNVNNLLQNFGYDRQEGIITAPLSVSSPSQTWVGKANLSGDYVEAAVAFSGSLMGNSEYGYNWQANTTQGVILGRTGLQSKGSFDPIARIFSTNWVSVHDFISASYSHVAAGSFLGTLTLPYSVNGSWTTSNADYFVASVDSARWVRILSSANADFLNIQIARDSAGNVYAMGTYSAALSYGGTSSLPAAGQNDIFVIKYSSSGAVLWAKSISGSGNDEAGDIVVCSDDSVVIAGTTSGILSFGSAGTINNSGGPDGFVAKLSPAGSFQWVVSLSSPNGEVYLPKLANGLSNSVWIGGSFSVSLSIVGTASTISQCTAPSGSSAQTGLHDGFLAQILANGNAQSVHPFSGDFVAWDYSSNATVNDVLMADSGDVYVTGRQDWSWGDDSGSNSFLFRLSGSSGEYREYPPYLRAILAGGGKFGFVSQFSENKYVGGVVIPGGLAVYLAPTGPLPAGESSVDSTPLLWAQAEATNGAVALGGLAYAVGDGSSALGNSNSYGGYSFSAGKSQANGKYSTSFGLSSASAEGTIAGGDSDAFGSYSGAFGKSTSRGNYSFSVGNSQALEEGAFSAGISTQATGSGSVALGNGSIASGANAFAMGGGSWGISRASGENSFAFGHSEASGHFSVAFGGSKASAYNAFSVGQAQATGYDAIALGWGTASGSQSFVFSSLAPSESLGYGSMAFGEGLSVSTPGTFVTGRYNLDEMTKNNSDDPAFVVGGGEAIPADEGPDTIIRRNALVVRKNGNVDISGKISMPRQGDILMGEFGNPE